MNQSASMQKHEGELRSYKIALLICLISLTGFFSNQTLAFTAAKKQGSNAQMATDISHKYTALVASTPLMAPPILDLSATQQATLISQGRLSSTELVSAYLTRIEAMDRKGPSIQSILSLNPNALDEARQKDAEVAQGKTLGRFNVVLNQYWNAVQTTQCFALGNLSIFLSCLI